MSRRFLELFESLGNVGSGVRAIFQPHELLDHPDAVASEIARGTIEFDAVDFQYPQGTRVFHRSLRENIRYGRIEASDVEVEEAARRARAAEFIAEIPEGYSAMVGERGVKLSGGQRQRIAIARVMLKNAPVLILDEATSSLDSITEQQIQAALDDAMVGKTVIVIAHRLSTIAHLDRILVFSNGEIVEDGSHAELLASRGAYSALWSRQSADGADVARPRYPRESFANLP
jgi:ABC-type transport system involved in Fe-S cluster assembly fused permease/ATPase subunit